MDQGWTTKHLFHIIEELFGNSSIICNSLDY
jgi:hypothetical protein